MPHTFEPIPYRPADEFASQAAQAQRHFNQRPTAGDGYTFNTVDDKKLSKMTKNY